METKRFTAPVELKDGGADEGAVKAAFSVFDVVDLQGDVATRGAFTAGQTVPMVWSHNWDQPIGKGTVRLTDEHAVFDGRFFTETAAGRDAYLTVKAMGDAQEWSFGFQVLDAEPAVRDGADVRILKKLEIFEASPVLVGANRATRTLAIKGHGLSYDEHSDQLMGSLDEWIERNRARSAQERKEGRPISAARRVRMGAVSAQIRTAADEIDGMLKETEPTPKAAAGSAAPGATASAGSAAAPPDAAVLALFDESRRLLARYGAPTDDGET